MFLRLIDHPIERKVSEVRFGLTLREMHQVRSIESDRKSPAISSVTAPLTKLIACLGKAQSKSVIRFLDLLEFPLDSIDLVSAQSI